MKREHNANADDVQTHIFHASSAFNSISRQMNQAERYAVLAETEKY